MGDDLAAAAEEEEEERAMTNRDLARGRTRTIEGEDVSLVPGGESACGGHPTCGPKINNRT
jgi:hypothetical protein